MTTPVAVQPDWTTQCRCGEKLVAVDPEMVQGAYAVHRTIKGSRAVGPGYTITHRPSGYAVWHVRALTQAVRVAQWLDKNFTLPATYELVWEWKQQLSSMERSRLVGSLTTIAPREWVADERVGVVD